MAGHEENKMQRAKWSALTTNCPKYSFSSASVSGVSPEGEDDGDCGDESDEE